MLNHMKAILLSALLIFTIAGCSGQEAQNGSSSQASSSPTQSSSVIGSVSEAVSSQAISSETESSQPESSEMESAAPGESSSAITDEETNTPATETAAAATTAGELTVQFGDDGAPFTMYLYDNSTAAAIASYVGTADWRLPIYNFDGYDNWEVMQYYDLPSRYEIPQNAETVTAEKAGEVFYSEPNRIVLFYGDGEVTGEYSRVGYFEATEDFVSAVQNNPVLEGWGNKIVLITE